MAPSGHCVTSIHFLTEVAWSCDYSVSMWLPCLSPLIHDLCTAATGSKLLRTHQLTLHQYNHQASDLIHFIVLNSLSHAERERVRDRDRDREKERERERETERDRDRDREDKPQSQRQNTCINSKTFASHIFCTC